MNRADLLKRLLVNRPIGSTDFVTYWDTSRTSTGSSTSTQIKLPLVSGGTYNMLVDWGDGNDDTITAWDDAAVTHTYSSSGNYTITITGTCVGWQFNNTGDRLKLIDVISWGILNLSTSAAFHGCANLCYNYTTSSRFFLTATDAPTITTTSFLNMFSGCTFFNADVGSWNTSTVTSLQGCFDQAIWFGENSTTTNINNWDVSNVTTLQRFNNGITRFNQPLNNWNVGNVTNMREAFYNSGYFDQNISNWNVSNCTDFYYMFVNASTFTNGGDSGIGSWVFKSTGTINMGGMFYGCTVFNHDLGLWNTNRVTNMEQMFYNCRDFTNGSNTNPLTGWNTALVTNMSGMFSGNTTTNSCKYNRDMIGFNTAAVTRMDGMFAFNTSFNQDIGGWNTSNVTNMSSMFADCTSFNQNIGGWNVTKVTTFANMFLRNTAFNNGGSSDIDDWVINTTNNVTMASMFGSNTGGGSSIFNQPIGSWNMTKVTTIDSMFRNANDFNQNIGSWSLPICTGFGLFMGSRLVSEYSTSNLDAIYNGWITTELSVSRTTTFGAIKYTAAGTEGRALLTRTNATVNVSNATDNGSGLIRITTSAVHGISTGNKVFIKGILGTVEANGLATITVIDTTTFDIDGSTFTNTYTSGGTVRTGYGWSITDGGI
jgi:surface protein